jgi:molecular chaperone HtpG
VGIGIDTNAEQLADVSRTLPGFKNLSLPGIKEQVAQILALIGRNGIFSTYTVHDISHIDGMLKMLDWIVPESTRKAMTPTDWLLSVLAIYFHDLGMVTTSLEYEQREENTAFVLWRSGLAKVPEGREYLARMNRMSTTEKERFLYQEFVRGGHAKRIREWVTGRHSQTWGPNVGPIATRVAELVKATPTRFRDYLGTVCESHHSEDLEKNDKYPLVARFGNEPGEVANVQYAAILLRTADLLHVTKDRTPSVMYQAIKFSDPKSVEEWDKQLGTFAVGPKTRRLDESDPDSAVIVINADFTEERPLFSLQEYVSYADSQVSRSNRWVEKSRESEDGKDYKFPWHKVEGDVRLEGIPPQQMRFELDRGRLLDLLVGHTIYNEPTVAIRELLQNGIDAVRYQAYLATREANKSAPSKIGKVVVEWKPEEQLLSVTDNGIGMDRDIIRHNLMSVGSSYYNTPQFESEHHDFAPISRFGIGILTCFMISDDIEIITFRGDHGFRIRMTSVKSTYLLRELEKGDPLLDGLEPHGTRVNLRVRDTVDLSKHGGVLNIVKYWVILPECAVEYHEAGQEPTVVGFQSAADALQAQYETQELPTQLHRSKLEMVVKVREVQEIASSTSRGKYELAFGVYSSFYPERPFADLQKATAPRVCIEGIRVSERLPGFELRPDFGALLSVRGSRRFRTTVSRAGLEVDDEYNRVAELCAEMLFDYVHDEGLRISKKPGEPLSQAASGVRYLSQRIETGAGGGPIRAKVRSTAQMQQSIVIERIDAAAGKPTATRALISPNELQEVPFFWTLESRAVDSLGTISLDLGRELSLNQFLLALAPDVTQLLQYTPILPDAHRSQAAVWNCHSPERIEFSRQHQQTAIKWMRKTVPSECELNMETLMSKPRLDALIALIRRTEQRHPHGLNLRIAIEKAPFSGDDPSVMAVSSRMGTVLQADSGLLQDWLTIRSGMVQLAAASALEDLMCALRIANAFAESLTWGRQGHEGSGPVIWRESISQFKSILANLQIPEELPGDLRVRITSLVVFDATSFWRDWDRPMQPAY